MLYQSFFSKQNYRFLEESEQKDIKQQVDFSLFRIIVTMGLLGCTANIISGAFFLWLVYRENYLTAWIWYGLLATTNLMMIFLCMYLKRISYTQNFNYWRRLLFLLFIVICLTWGSITIVFQTENLVYQLSILAFLLAVVIGFSLPSITDFTLALISIICLLAPSIIFYLYESHIVTRPDHELNILYAISTSLIILGLFLLTVTRISSQLVRQFFQLSFANTLLNRKLENANKFLEQRVKERTIDLENTLQQVTHRATHDLLTDLPNQRSLINFMKASIKTSRRNSCMFAVVFFAINEIDLIYNALGYQTGDVIIKLIAKRLQQLYPEPSADGILKQEYTVTLSRNSVFVFLIQPIYEISEVEQKIKPLFSVLEKPIHSEKQALKLTASIGVSLYPHHGRNITNLLMNADAAMLLARQLGGNAFKMYKSEINASISQRLEIENELHTALNRSEFVLQYQPIIDLKTGRIVAAEALIRWDNPTYGRIPPDEFIPLAEANGIILPLGEWIIRTACHQIKLWQQEGYEHLSIAINLSAKQVSAPNFTHSLIKILKEFDLNPKAIEFELTERIAFREDVLPILRDIKAAGIRFSIDDFGTGYSGLSNIKRISVDKIKIDKSFVQDVITSKDSSVIVTNIIALAKNMSAVVVAEGVETKEQLDFLLAHDCDLAQGYYFSRPVEHTIFTTLLKSNISFS